MRKKKERLWDSVTFGNKDMLDKAEIVNDWMVWAGLMTATIGWLLNGAFKRKAGRRMIYWNKESQEINDGLHNMCDELLNPEKEPAE